MTQRINRRQFIRDAALTGAAMGLGGCKYSSLVGAEAAPLVAPRKLSPNEKLNIGMIGVMNRAAEDLKEVQGENIVAICDIDDDYLNKVKGRFPAAKVYNDFRKLLEQKDIDAVVVATPDHTHMVAAISAMQLGKHVYCEKPLGHNVWEVRKAAETAKKYGVATQMGTQIHASDNYRRVVEILKSGAIGSVSEAHVWVGKDWSGGDRPKETPPVPPNIHWDLWLGPAPERPYHSTYIPFYWRRWWDFGGGTLADMGCHYIDLVFWALDLRHPLTIEAEGAPPHPETGPKDLKVTWQFPARGDQPPVKLMWYDGGARPQLLTSNEEFSVVPKNSNPRKNLKTPPVAQPIKNFDAGIIFVGQMGMLFANYDFYQLLPFDAYESFEPPNPSIPASIGHHKEWIEACKTGSPTTCNFDYSGALTETVLLGNVAYRSGKLIEWDPVKLIAKNAPDAAKFIKREYRKGWEI